MFLGALAVATGLVIAGGCAKKEAEPTAQAGPNNVNVTAADYAFLSPDSIPAGLELFHLVNRGPALHHLQIVQLLDGKTVTDLTNAMRNPGPPPPWVKWVGGPNAAVPSGGDTTAAFLTLPAGNYALLCLIPDSTGTPHVALGMVKPLTVTASSATPAAEPPSDIQIHLTDYDFTITGALTPGLHNIRIVNDGPQTHEMLVAALAPGKSAKDLVDWIHAGFKGMPPAKPIGGAAALGSGAEQMVTVQLAPGNYGLFCFLPDIKDGKEHVAHGMVKQITVN
jgi:hypothetical protein